MRKKEPCASIQCCAPPPPAAPQVSVADELTKLIDLREKGFLTDDEYSAQKARLLGG